MVNFVASMRKGLDLARQADENNREIDLVFDELNKQLNEFFSGKVLIVRGSSHSIKVVINAISVWNKTFFNENESKNLELVAINPTVEHFVPKSLADWSQAVTGYPCSLSLAGQKYICEDKESLEIAIADLLANPLVAKTLLKVKEAEVSETIVNESLDGEADSPHPG